MADINLTSPVTDGDTVTAQTLHDLIETATFSGLSTGDFAAGLALIWSGASSPDPSLYSYWWSTHHFEPLLFVYARPFNIWLAVGPDRFDFPMKAAKGIKKGSPVIAAGASLVTTAANATLNWVGFAQNTAVSGAWLPVACCGIGWIQSLASGTPGKTFTTHGAAEGYVRASGSDTASNATFAFGIYLDNPLAGNSWSGVSLHGFRALIWGPKYNKGLG